MSPPQGGRPSGPCSVCGSKEFRPTGRTRRLDVGTEFIAHESCVTCGEHRWRREDDGVTGLWRSIAEAQAAWRKKYAEMNL